MSDIDIIRKIEKEISYKLEKVELEKLSTVQRQYSLNKRDEVVGLSLFGTGLKEIPSDVFELLKLTKLFLFDNQITTLPPEIGNLVNLNGLYLYNNQLTTLPTEIGNLVNLNRLSLFNNQLTTLPQEIGNLVNLNELSLGNNQLTTLPQEIGNLIRLKYLWLQDNKLTSIPEEFTALNIDWHWTYDSSKTGVFFADNPLTEPPVEIVRQGRGAVIAWFEAREKDELLPVYEVKVLLIGEPKAGKTCLRKRIKDEGYNPEEPMTAGIDIEPWDFMHNGIQIKVKFWDFGGQEIMHATHQFFMSESCMYVLLLDGRAEEDPENWLSLIKTFGADSPVIVILNKIDDNPNFSINKRFLQEKYENLKEFINVSCSTPIGIEQVKATLKREIPEIDLLQKTWFRSWLGVKEKIESMSEPFISKERFEELCCDSGVTKKEHQDTLIGYLNNLGIAIHFKQFDLRELHVLDPHWVTRGVYKILNSPDLKANKGLLDLELLTRILVKRTDEDYKYTAQHQRYLIRLMREFQLCYKLEREKDKVLIPDLLDEDEPPISFDMNDTIRFHLDYNFLPKSIMPQFIVRMNQYIKSQELVWRTGVVLRNEKLKSEALVKSDKREKRIAIDVNGVMRRDFFARILHQLQFINDQFNIKVIEKLCLPDMPTKRASYTWLINLAIKGEEVCYPEEAGGEEYSIQKLLGSVLNPKPTEAEMLTILRILQSYADEERKGSRLLRLWKPFGFDFNVLKEIIEKYTGRIEL